MTSNFLEDNKLKSFALPFILRGRGCQECQNRGYTVTNYRDEVRDDDTYYTCVSCLSEDERKRIQLLYEKEFGTYEEREAKKRQEHEERVKRAIREGEEKLQKLYEERITMGGVHVTPDFQDIEWTRRRAQTDLAKFEQKMDKRLGKIMNDYDEKIHELQVRLEAVERRVPFSITHDTLYDHRLEEERRIAEGENE